MTYTVMASEVMAYSAHSARCVWMYAHTSVPSNRVRAAGVVFAFTLNSKPPRAWVLAYVVMAYIVMASRRAGRGLSTYIVMVYLVMAGRQGVVVGQGPGSNDVDNLCMTRILQKGRSCLCRTDELAVAIHMVI